MLILTNMSYISTRFQQAPRGYPLSPLFAAVYLQPLDELARKNKHDYVRYMDGFVIFAKSHHQLRRIIKDVYRILND